MVNMHETVASTGLDNFHDAGLHCASVGALAVRSTVTPAVGAALRRVAT